MIFAFLGPSGVGKTTVVNKLGLPEIKSTTTRPKRVDEDDRAYHFVTDYQFNLMLTCMEFIEHVVYSDHQYGLLKRNVNMAADDTSQNYAVILDAVGCKKLKELYPNNVKVIYLLAPVEDLVKFMEKRGDKPESIIKRLTNIIKTNELNNHDIADLVINSTSINNICLKATLFIKSVTENAVQVLEDNVLHSTPFVKLIERSYLDADHKSHKWCFAQRNNDSKAVMIIAMHGDKLVVIEEYRVVIDDMQWSFPAGLVDEYEHVEDAASRELFEETGLTLERVLHTSPYVYNSVGITDESITLVYCTASGEISNKFQEASEDIETSLMTKEDVQELLTNNFKFDAKSYMIFKQFAETGSISDKL